MIQIEDLSNIPSSNTQEKELFQEIINTPETGFFYLTKHHDLITSAQQVHKKFLNKKHFVQVGIGGSSLGPMMLLKNLQKNEFDFHFLDNVDSDLYTSVFSQIDIHQSLFYIVSKSGGTAETIAGLSIILSKLQAAGIDSSSWSDYIVCCTDKEKGDLRKFATDYQLETLHVPNNIGGRFSVLSHVGLFPALFADIDIEALFRSSNEFGEKLIHWDQFYKIAQDMVEFHSKGINETVLIPYSSKLKSFSDWFVQLWAESLGKEEKGFTPISSHGATDQHAQVQLFMEGPRNKHYFFIEVKNKDYDFKLSNSIDLPSFNRLSAHSLNELMNAELQGTLKAFQENNLPLYKITLPHLDEDSLASLILFFESLTALVGRMLEIDPFNQPGVEAGKKYAYECLQKQS